MYLKLEYAKIKYLIVKIIQMTQNALNVKINLCLMQFGSSVLLGELIIARFIQANGCVRCVKWAIRSMQQRINASIRFKIVKFTLATQIALNAIQSME